MKAFIFLVFSVLIHCYIFDFPLLRNSQESSNKRLFLRDIKAVKPFETRAVQEKSNDTVFSEPKLFAPKELSPHEASKLNYRDGLIHLIQSKSVNPIMAQDLEQTGTVVVSVELDKDGKIINFKIDQKSDYELLNEAALAVFESLRVYKPLPRVLHPYATFLIPIHFL